MSKHHITMYIIHAFFSTLFKTIKMKQIIFIIALLASQLAFTQEKIDYYQLGGKYASEGNYKKAIENFKLEVEKNPGNYYAWFNLALSESFFGQNENSIKDFSKAIELKPDYYKAYLNRALVKRDITNYKGALSDLNKSLEIEPNYSSGFYHRAVINEYLKNYEQACKDITKAKKLGEENVDKIIEVTCSEKRSDNYANILSLSNLSKDNTYGFSSDNPIKVGTGLKGGAANQRAFLNLLLDKNGNPVNYKRLGSCCDYKSEHGFIGGIAKLDIYEITYLNKKGKEKKTKLYLSFYDYEEPMIPIGFETIQ